MEETMEKDEWGKLTAEFGEDWGGVGMWAIDWKVRGWGDMGANETLEKR